MTGGEGGDARPGIHLGITVSRQMGFKATGMDDITGEACRERGAQDKVLEPPPPLGQGLNLSSSDMWGQMILCCGGLSWTSGDV